MPAGGVRKLGDFARARARRDLGIARELGELPGRQLLAEKERRRVGQLMRLVEDQRIARGQELGEALVPQHHVGEEQMMVDDDDVRFERRLARLQHEAVGVERAFGAEAVVARRRDERPDRRVLRDVGQRAAIAGLGRAGERDDLRQVPRVVARRKAPVGRGSLEMMVADVVRAALEQRERDRNLQRVAHERQVALEELVLQRLGAGGHDHLAAVQERRHEIREGLAGAGAGLGDQCAAARDRVRDGVGHRELLRAKAKAGQRAGQEAALAEDRGQLAVGDARAGVGRGGECGVAQVALLVLGGGFAGLPCLALVGGGCGRPWPWPPGARRGLHSRAR